MIVDTECRGDAQEEYAAPCSVLHNGRGADEAKK